MKKKVLFISTVGGWCSFDNDATFYVVAAGDLIVNRGDQQIAYFKLAAWNGWIYVESNEGWAGAKSIETEEPIQ